jgi:hypothetical protein
VTCGGETSGIEAMGNTRCGENKKVVRNADGTFSLAPWGGHSDYLDDAPYFNFNDGGDPNNSFFSSGNE